MMSYRYSSTPVRIDCGETAQSIISTSLRLPDFLLATQLLFLLCYCGLLLAVLLLTSYMYCLGERHRVKVLRVIGTDLLVSGKCK